MATAATFVMLDTSMHAFVITLIHRVYKLLVGLPNLRGVLLAVKLEIMHSIAPWPRPVVSDCKHKACFQNSVALQPRRGASVAFHLQCYIFIAKPAVIGTMPCLQSCLASCELSWYWAAYTQWKLGNHIHHAAVGKPKSVDGQPGHAHDQLLSCQPRVIWWPQKVSLASKSRCMSSHGHA